MRLTASAKRDLVEAGRWYERAERGLGEALFSVVDLAIDLLAEHASAFPVVHGEVRRVPLRRFPYALYSMLRGPISIAIQDGVTAEYAASARRYLGDDAGGEWVANLEQQGAKMARISLRPTWVGLLDFEKRFPSALGGVVG